MKTVALVACGGSGKRAHLGYNKVLHISGGISILEHTLSKFSCPCVIVFNEQDDKDTINKIAKKYNALTTLGGSTRTQSVKNGLELIKNSYPDCEVVLIHDGARPYLSPDLIQKIAKEAYLHGSAIPYTICSDSVKQKTESGYINIDRASLMYIQTPQGFLFDKIYKAYSNATDSFTDDSAVYEQLYGDCHMVEGEVQNTKITTPYDIKYWERFVMTDTRVGNGYDYHRFDAGRKLILGGVEIPFEKGLLGHSDADAATHCLMDAMLSAAGLKDIGTYFPDNDNKYKGANSIELLKQVSEILLEQGYRLSNASIVIVAQYPKLAPFVDQMKANLASATGLTPDRIGISATTNEGSGAIGRGEGIAATAVCLLVKTSKDML